MRNITFADAAWDDAIEADLATLADETWPLDWMRRQVEGQGLAAWSVAHAGRHVLTILWRLDDGEPAGRCFLIFAAAARVAELDLTAEVLPLIEERARGMGCVSVKFHTRRMGLIARTADQGYRAAEWVLRKRIAV